MLTQQIRFAFLHNVRSAAMELNIMYLQNLQINTFASRIMSVAAIKADQAVWFGRPYEIEISH